MRKLITLITSTAALSALALTFTTPAPAGDHCKRVRAKINLSEGTIAGNAGLDGTVVFAADSNGTAPSTAPANASVFSGILVVTTKDGTLDVRETGMFSSRVGNPAGPVLSSWGDVLSGTGEFAGATGDLTFVGRRVDGVLIVETTGELCRP